MRKLDIAEGQVSRILSGDGKRILADVDSGDSTHWSFTGNRDGNGTASRAEVQHLPFRLPWNFPQGEIHQHLCFRARYERRRADRELQRPEFLHAHDVCHGLAIDTPGDNIIEAAQRHVIELVLGMSEQVAARHIDGPTQQ